MALPSGLRQAMTAALGAECVRADRASLLSCAADALGESHLPDLVVVPASTRDVASVARLCTDSRVPLVVRGTGTGYTGGAVPIRGGVVLSLEKLNRIVQIDGTNLLAVVEPNVVNGDLQRAVERVGLFYPPDPASLESSSIGGNVAECAGGPRAFKYGTTKRYVLGLEAVLPTGEIVRTGSKAVKNVVGYDLTQLLVGSEGTLAIITQVTLRLIPKPAVRTVVRICLPTIQSAVDVVTAVIGRRVVPSAVELLDGESLRALDAFCGRHVAAEGTRAMVVVECDGTADAVREEVAQVTAACREAGAVEVRVAGDDAERDEIWAIRRQLSLALRATGLRKINHDVVVPRGRVSDLLDSVAGIGRRFELRTASFGHAGDGNIHVNFLIDSADAGQLLRARQAERSLFEEVVALEGSISGEHGIGFTKAPYLGLELSADLIALMKRVKVAFDPAGILNPGKIFP